MAAVKQQQEKKENTVLYLVYAAAAYFGLQLMLKPKRAAAVTITPNKVADAPPETIMPVYVPPPVIPVAKSTWIAESFPLRKGMKGNNIKALQQKLGINPDGAFGNDTETALLQQYSTTTVNQQQFQSIVKGTASVTPGSKATTTWIAESFPLRKGMKGNNTKALQQKLGISADGAFGSGTEAAVQKKFGVTTVSQSLFSSLLNPVSSTVSKIFEAVVSKAIPDLSPILKSGSKGQDVYRLQKWMGFKDKKTAKKGERIADSIFGGQTLSALQAKTGKTSISVNQLNNLMKQVAGMGYAGEVLVTKRPAMVLDVNLRPHRTVPENTILGKRLMELTDPQDQKAYTQFQTVDGLRRWIATDAV